MQKLLSQVAQMIKLSVIIPVYNSERKGLANCLDSLTRQSFKDFELILINDGSTDNSFTICKEFEKKDSRIRTISKENTGVSDSRNTGLSIASGEYITFIDSDDFVEQDYLKELISNAYNSDLVICGIKQHFPNNEKIFKTQAGLFKADDSTAFHRLIKSRLVFGPCNKLFRTEIIKKNNILFPTDTDYGEDRIFCFNYLRHIRNFRIIDTIYYDYQMYGEDSLSGKYRENLFFIEYHQWRKLFELYQHLSCLTNDALKDLFIELFWLVNDAIADLYKHRLLSPERVNAIIKIPELTLINCFKKEIKTNRLIKSLILNRNASGIVYYYKFLKLCKK